MKARIVAVLAATSLGVPGALAVPAAAREQVASRSTTQSGTASAAAAPAALPNAVFVPLAARRVLDTRTTLGGVRHVVAAGTVVEFVVTGVGGVPASGVAAVAVTLTAIAPTASGALVAYPAGAAPPGTTTVSAVARQDATGLTVVRPGTGGQIAVYNKAGAAHLTADITGYYASAGSTSAGSTLVPLAAQRVLDTRTTVGGVGHALASGTAASFPVTGVGGVPSTGVAAVVIALTAVAPAAAGSLVAYPYSTTPPATTSLSAAAGRDTTALVLVRPGRVGRVAVYNRAGLTHLTADVTGYYAAAGTTSAGGTFVGLAARRVLDTRTPLGGVHHAVGAGTAANFPVTGVAGVPAAGVRAVVFAITAVRPAAAGSLAAYPYGATRPATTSVSVAPLTDATTLVVVRPGTGGRVAVYNRAGSTHLTADVVGYYATLTVPRPPAGVITTAADRGAHVAWTPPAAPTEAPVTGYRITASPGGATAVVGSVASFTAGGLTNGTTYRFTVAARNVFGFGPPSPLSTAVVPVPPAVPGAPTAVTATPGHNGATVEWAPPTADGGAAISGYTITANPGGQLLTATGDARAATVTGLTDGVTYAISVAATNTAGTGAATAAPPVVPAVTVPGAPSLVTAAPDGDAVVVTWSPPQDDGGHPVTGYQVTADPDGATVTTDATATSTTMGGLDPATPYTFNVVAVNDVGAGAAAVSAPAGTALNVAAAAVVLSPESMAALVAAHTDGSLDFADPPAQVSGLSPGAVLVAGAGPQTPDGLLATVLSVTATDALTTIATRPATLDEALGEATFGFSGTPAVDDAVFTPARPGVRMMQSSSASLSGTLKFGISRNLYKDSLGHAITVNGTASITPRLSFAASIHCCVHVSTRFSASLTAKADLTIDAAVSHGIEVGYTLGQVRLPSILIQVGPVPVLITETLSISLIARGTVSAGLDVSVSASATLGVDITTNDGSVRIDPYHRWTTGFAPPTVYGAVSAKAGIQKKLQLTINGIPGPYFTNDLWVFALDANYTKDPWWTLSVESDLGAGEDLRLIGHTFASWHNDHLRSFALEYAHASGPFHRLAITPSPAKVTAGQTLQLAASLDGDPATNVTWSTPGGGSVTNGGLFTAPATPGTYTVLASRPAAGLAPAASGIADVRVGAQPPGAPTAVAATASGIGSAAVRWTAPADDGGAPVTHYTVTASPGDATAETSHGTEATVSGLSGGVAYTFTVTASNSGGTSQPSLPSAPVVVADRPPSGWQPGEPLLPTIVMTSLGAGRFPKVSGDGRYVTTAAPLAGEPHPQNSALTRYDLDTGETLDLMALFGRTGRIAFHGPTMDADGSTLAWWDSDCHIGTLVVGQVDTSVATQVGRVPNACSEAAFPAAQPPDMSIDGRYVLFWGVPEGTPIQYAGYACANCRSYIYDTERKTYEDRGTTPLRMSGNGRFLFRPSPDATSMPVIDRLTGATITIPVCTVGFMLITEVSTDGNVIAGSCDTQDLWYAGFTYNLTSDLYTYNFHPYPATLAPVQALDATGSTMVVRCPDCTDGRAVTTSGTFALPDLSSAALSGDGGVVAIETTGEVKEILVGELPVAVPPSVM
jgi:hypothetical protein